MFILASELTDNLRTMGVPIAEKAARTVLVYLGLLILLRVAGKRDLAQLNSFDLVVLLLLSNVVQNAVIGPDNSLVGGLIGAAILVGVNSVLVRTVASKRSFVRLFEGTPTSVVRDGKLVRSSLRRLGLAEEDVVSAVRRQGASSIDEVREATLSPGGAITVELEPDDENATKGDIYRLEAKLDRLLAAGG